MTRLTIIKTLSIAFLFVLLSSCRDLLEKTPEAALGGDSFNSEQNLTAVLYGTYDVLQWQSMGGGTHVFPVLFQSVRGDDMNSQQANFWGLGARFDDFQLLDANNQSVRFLWKKWYTGVNRANLVIEKAGEFDGWTTDGLQEQLIAEAKTLRAFFYFELVKNWGDVPLFTKALTTDLPVLARSPKQDVYGQIDRDLTEAVNSGGLQSKGGVDAGRITLGTAKTLLAKSKLYQKDYTACTKYCEEVINSGAFALEANFADNFSLSNENGVESILEIQYEDGFNSLYFEQADEQQQGSAMWQMCFTWVAAPWTSFGNMLPRGELLALYDPVKDTRFDATFITQTTDISTASPLLNQNWLGGNGIVDQHIIQAFQGAGSALATEDMNLSRKYFISWETLQTLLATSQSPLNEKIIRYAEVLLMHAEARTMGGTGTIAGLASLNRVRTRAGLDALTAYTLDDVKLERRKELATEGWNRFSDLIRWGDAAGNARMTEKNFTAGRDELLPVPQNEIDAIGADILSQNPGY